MVELSLETIDLSEHQRWALDMLGGWLRWKGLYLFCAPSLLIEMSKEAHLSPHAATGIISAIEGYFSSESRQWCNGTKVPTQYKRLPLKGFWKAHLPFQNLSTMARNLANEMEQPWMDRELNKIITTNETTHQLSEEQCKKIASLFVVKALKNRSMRGSMTGHWLVFSRVEDKNYYLTLARHNEPDAHICMRAKAAARHYPLLPQKAD